MRNVKMDKTGLLAAAIYSILENRLARNLVDNFSVRVEVIVPDGLPKNEVMLGSRISGYVQINSTRRREFAIDSTCFDQDLRVEVSYKTSSYRDKPIAHIDVKGHVEIDFDKRTITYKKVHDFNMKNVSWDWESCKGTALDIIGMIYSD